MSPKLPEIIRDLIRQRGALSVGEYMALCLGHPQYGYYMSHEPFGALGDFTTAPEISQLFGEMIAVWVMTTWEKLGKPQDIQIVEMGPGRGTLMKDLWRGLYAMPELQSIVKIHLVDFSPRLQTIQKENLEGRPVTWHQDFKTVPQQPSLIIANEFFDALPIQQAVYHQGQWYMRQVIADEEDLLFGLGNPLQGIFVGNPQDGDIFEYAPLSADIMDHLCEFLKKNNGALLAIDYGDEAPLDERIGETLQALYQQKPDPVLDHPGDADITAHVAFDSLKHIARDHNLLGNVQTQADFLRQQGILLRAQALLEKANPEQAKTLNEAMHRLLDTKEMGELFKVFEMICS
jgi:SAM-dependent MidA family methyltransferase